MENIWGKTFQTSNYYYGGYYSGNTYTGSWIYTNRQAIVRMTTAPAGNSAASIKTTNGAWSISTVGAEKTFISIMGQTLISTQTRTLHLFLVLLQKATLTIPRLH